MARGQVEVRDEAGKIMENLWFKDVSSHKICEIQQIYIYI